ncbi:ABC-2 family transporter protein [Sedimentibacter sp. zth1]|uniref:ABC-2 family transporter protein n=1 Tax=Sedimentibacter sp. zth1 TaxID=2816908 RepID=UPI001A926241|nr:ABC-2 family transporter protein [Sedimentibacter sp. zth1]QSX05005.1 ABC-2 family transporter protein [Sedimentibacter sp. zth1]
MKVSMVKYIFLIKTYIKTYKKYPLGLFLKLIYLPVQMLMYIFLWINIGKSSNIDIQYLILYYLLTNLLLYAYPFTHIATDIQTDVMEGGIANYLVRPYSYITLFLAKYISWMALYSVIFIPTIIVIYFLANLTVLQVFMFIVTILIGMFVEFMFWFNVGLISLYIERIKGVMTTAMAIRMFVSGSIIPLTYFPEMFQKLTYFFPFRYYIYVPVSSVLTQNSFNEIILNLSGGLIWLLLLSISSLLLWNRGVKILNTNMG